MNSDKTPYDVPAIDSNPASSVTDEGADFYDRWSQWQFETKGAEEYAVEHGRKTYGFGREEVVHVYDTVTDHMERDLDRTETEKMLREMNANISPHKIYDKIKW
jgi:hypothetical protein